MSTSKLSFLLFFSVYFWYFHPYFISQFIYVCIYVDNGDVYAWGLNQHGQCGVGHPAQSSLGDENLRLSSSNDWILNVYVPLKVEGLPPVAEIHCGWSHTVAVIAGKE